jgi:transmembrane sensor
MQEDELQILIDKYLKGTANPAEKQKIDHWYQQQNEKDVVWMLESPAEKEKIEKQMLSILLAHVRPAKSQSRTILFKSGYRIAAIITACCLVSGYFFFKNYSALGLGNTPVIVSLPSKINENRFITLPDSSTVILHPGSAISYSKVGHERRLILEGEAYFDIRHRAHEPFVVCTGDVKTTVLGTSFNIRAYKGKEVVVSVTKGKVSVVNNLTKALAILLPDQQVTLKPQDGQLNLRKVKATQSILWANSDMQIDEMPFRELAARLSRRYDVKIRFNNPRMEKCLISGRFTGTEKLDEVLDVISKTMGSTYKISNAGIILDGQECVN